MGLDIYFEFVNGETGEKKDLEDLCRGRDLFHIMGFAMSKTGFNGYSAQNIEWSMINYDSCQEESEITDNDSYKVWSIQSEIEALIIAIKKFNKKMKSSKKRKNLISYSIWHEYYPNADYNIMYWTKNFVKYYK